MSDPPRRRVPNEDPGPTPDDAGLRVVRDTTPVRYDADAERSMLANILAHGLAVWNQVESLLRPEDFYVPNHAHIYAAMRTLAGAGTSPWPAVVVDQLRRDKLLETVGGHKTIDELQWGYEMGSYGAVQDHARLIASYARSRRLLAYAAEMAEAAKRNDHVAALEVLRKASEEEATGEAAASWAPVDMAALLEAGVEPVLPTMLLRGDQAPLVYPAKTHAFNADSESGKSWLALFLCVERILAGEHVVYLDFEADAASIAERLLALELPEELIVERFHYVRPDDPFDLAARARLLELVANHGPTVAIIDGVAEVMAMNGWDENANAEIAAFFNAIPRLLERQGCAVVMIDHLVKDKKNQDRYARGGAHKLAGISGAAYKLEKVKDFGRGHAGMARVVVTKDRHGRIRALCGTSPRVAEFELLAPIGEDVVRAELKAPDWASGPDEEEGVHPRPTYFMEQYSIWLESQDGAITYNKLRAAVTGNVPARNRAIRNLVNEGFFAVEQQGQAKLHTSVRPYRQADEVPTQGELGASDPGPVESEEEYDLEPF
jgi:hypothetical protein